MLVERELVSCQASSQKMAAPLVQFLLLCTSQLLAAPADVNMSHADPSRYKPIGRLPSMFRVYVEMKARDVAACVPADR
jgi:hypothetical protein